MFVRKIGIDLGTCNSLAFVPGKGVVINEPSVVAVSVLENKVMAVGAEAKKMIGRTPDTIKVYRPLRDGVIAEYKITEAMLRYFIEKSLGRWSFFKPDLVVGVPAGITSTEKRAVIEAGTLAGAKNVYLTKEPVLAAIGAGIPINSCSGHMIVDIGGGTSEVAVLSLGGIVTYYSLRTAGDKLDESIVEYIKKKYKLAIGIQTAEDIKIKIGTAVPVKEEMTMNVRGRDLILGLPRNIDVSSNEVAEAMEGTLDEMIKAIRQVLRDTPPELSADIMDKGMVVAGGGALLREIDVLISESTGVPCFIAEDPLVCVAKGTSEVLDHIDAYKRSIMIKK
ncbi:MAG: rod shape-determining protein [Candidatus Pacebacteria bacterium]|nr:rod shape-determining protein [Candidatus Paceibacterota bacterium]